MAVKASITISRADARGVVRLLHVLEDLLSSAIESNLVPGTNKPRPEDAVNVRLDRRDRAAARQFRTKLSKLERAR